MKRHTRDITTLEELRAAMTNQTGSRRYPGLISGSPDRAPDGDIGPSPDKSRIAHWRIVDPIRKTALECAVSLTCALITYSGKNLNESALVELAAELERYLTGEEADSR